MESGGHFHPHDAEAVCPPAWSQAVSQLLGGRPTRPLLAWGHDFASAEAIKALHAHGCHVLETWPGDSLLPGQRGEHLQGGAAGNGASIRHLAQATQCRRVDGRPVVLLVSDVDRICSTGRAMLKTLFEEAKGAAKEAAKAAAKPKRVRKKRKLDSRPAGLAPEYEWAEGLIAKKAPPPLRVVCTCSDYYAPSMKTVMHGLVPKAAALQLKNRGQPRTPWQAVDAVRTRPSDGGARQADADQLLREDPRILATLFEHSYELGCLAEVVGGPNDLGAMGRAANVAEHFAVCDLLAPLTARKRKLHEDDDEVEPNERPGNDAHIAALGMGLAMRDGHRPQYLQGAYAIGVRPKRAVADLDEIGGPLGRALSRR